MINTIEDQLRRDEGEKLFVYPDSLGYWTIGVGRMVDRRKGGGITPAESTYLLINDIEKVETELYTRLPWTKELDPVRFAVLVNMAFQMGINGLLGFVNTLQYVRSKQYNSAALGMLGSLWAKQTPARAMRLAEQMRTGVWQ